MMKPGRSIAVYAVVCVAVCLASITHVMAMDLSVALKSDVVSLDPTKQDDLFSQHVILQIYEGLFGYNETGDVIPLLVDDWKAIDGREYQFTLKKGILYHNGEEMTSDDVIASFEKILSKDSINWWALSCIDGADNFHAGTAGQIKGLQKIDRYRLRILLTETFSPFIKVLASPYAPIMPASLIRSGHDFNKSPVGSGPYRIIDHLGTKEINLTHFGAYHGGSTTIKDMKILTSVLDPVALFNEHKIDYVAVFNADHEAQISVPSVYHKVYQYAVWLMAFNLKANVTSPEVRQAFSYAIDRSRLCDRQADYVHPTDRFIPTGLQGSVASRQSNTSDVEKARKLTDEIPANRRKLEIIYPEKINSFPATLDLFRELCSSLGIKCTHKVLPMAELCRRLITHSYQAAVIQVSPSYRDTDSILYPYFYSGSPLNLIGLKDEAIDDLLTKARRTTDIALRSSYYRQVDDRLCENAYIIPMYFEQVKLFFSPKLRGFSVYGMSIYDLQYKHLR